MEHTDEKILHVVKELEEAKHKNIYESVKVKGVTYHFVRQAIYDGLFYMHIPESFSDLEEEIAKFKYPSESRPEIIKTDRSGGVTVTFSLVDDEVGNEDIEDIKNNMQMAFKKMQPANVFYEDAVIDVKGHHIGYYEFKSYALDSPIFNIMYFVEVNGKLLVGTLACVYKDYKYWRPILHQMMGSIEVSEDKEENA